MRVLPVIRNLGGCGGTLVSRLFAALPGTVVLSETNPRSAHLFAGHLNALSQLRKWHPECLEGLGNLDDAEIGYPPKFAEMLDRLHGTVTRRGGRLIVRDFNYVDFIGVPFIWPVPADNALDAAVAGTFQVRDIVLVRSPPEQLASLRSHRAISHVLSAERFLNGYAGFLRANAAAPIFHYEDLIASPPQTFRAMCEALGLLFDASALQSFTAMTNVTGSLGRFGDVAITAPPPSAAAAWAAEELAALPGYPDLLDSLRYVGPDSARDTRRSAAATVVLRKQFFSEEKNQKTFTSGARG